MPKFIFSLIRHAQSHANANMQKEDKIGGHNLEVELTEEGKKQAEQLGDYLKQNNIHFDKIYASTAVRTQQTAVICFKRLGIHPDIQVTEKILEQSHGGWMGKSRKIYQREDVRKALDHDNWNYIPGDEIPGESQKMVAERMLNFLQTLLNDLKDSAENCHIALFTHGLAIKFLLAELLNLDRKTAYTDAVNPIDNASITQLCYDEDLVLQPITVRNFKPRIN